MLLTSSSQMNFVVPKCVFHLPFSFLFFFFSFTSSYFLRLQRKKKKKEEAVQNNYSALWGEKGRNSRLCTLKYVRGQTAPPHKRNKNAFLRNLYPLFPLAERFHILARDCPQPPSHLFLSLFAHTLYRFNRDEILLLHSL